MRNGAGDCEWRHKPEVRRGFGEIWKSHLSGELDTEREGSTFAARSGQTNLREMVVGGQMKSQNRKNVYLSPYVEEPLKSFVPELRSRKCFFVFRDSYVLCIYVINIMNVLCTGMDMSILRSRVWLWYIPSGWQMTFNSSIKMYQFFIWLFPHLFYAMANY